MDTLFTRPRAFVLLGIGLAGLLTGLLARHGHLDVLSGFGVGVSLPNLPAGLWGLWRTRAT